MDDITFRELCKSMGRQILKYAPGRDVATACKEVDYVEAVLVYSDATSTVVVQAQLSGLCPDCEMDRVREELETRLHDVLPPGLNFRCDIKQECLPW
jgi:hypothetical protein